MSLLASRDEIMRFLTQLGREYKGQAILYLVGGSMMVLQGFKSGTRDIDYKVDLAPSDHSEFVAALRRTQRVIPLDVEPASPGDFIPLPSGWRERCRYVMQASGLTIYTFDPLATALAKIERGEQRDIDDVIALYATGIVSLDDIRRGFEDIAPRIEREALPRVTEEDFRRKVQAAIEILSQAQQHQES